MLLLCCTPGTLVSSLGTHSLTHSFSFSFFPRFISKINSRISKNRSQKNKEQRTKKIPKILLEYCCITVNESILINTVHKQRTAQPHPQNTRMGSSHSSQALYDSYVESNFDDLTGKVVAITGTTSGGSITSPRRPLPRMPSVSEEGELNFEYIC